MTRVTAFRLEVDCPRCDTGVYELSGVIYPAEPSLRAPFVDFEEARRIGRHGEACPLDVPVESLGDVDALAERVMRNERMGP